MATGLLESIDRSTQLAGHNRLALLLFRLGPRQFFGINVFKVQEVIRCPPLTAAPGAHPYVRGIAAIRGRVIPVIDLQKAIGGEALGEAPAQHVVIAEFNRSTQGFLVSQVDRIIHVNVAELRPPPSGAGESYLTAVMQHAQQLVEVIDVEKVLAEINGGPAGLDVARRQAAQQLPRTARKVLVADDSKVARAQIERVLGELGVDSILVADGREALQQLQRLAESGPVTERLLMVLSDVEMPFMDGYTLTTEIRRDPRLRDLYVLLHSSLSGVFNNSMVQKVGADRFIAKFGADELADAVLERLHDALPA